jgi:uncharacterized protein YqeY
MQNVHIFSGLISGQVIAGRFTAPRGLADLGCLMGANGLDQGFMVMRPFEGSREDMTMLRDDINNAVKDAMRAKDERKLSTLRMVNSTIKNADIAARGEGKPPLTDADLLGVFQKMIKQRQESVELYDKGGRAELAAQEREEIAIISAYLPKQMSEDDVKAAIAAVIAETNASGIKDMGKVIGALKAKYAGQMDFGKASGMVKSALSS